MPKRISAADMLKQGRRDEEPAAETPHPESEPVAQEEDAAIVIDWNVPEPSPNIYERITVYIRPGQRQWLEETLDRDVRDRRGRRIRSLSISDIIRLAITHLQTAVQEENYPLLEHLILAAHVDAKTMHGKKNRGIPKLRQGK